MVGNRLNRIFEALKCKENSFLYGKIFWPITKSKNRNWKLILSVFLGNPNRTVSKNIWTMTVIFAIRFGMEWSIHIYLIAPNYFVNSNVEYKVADIEWKANKCKKGTNIYEKKHRNGEKLGVRSFKFWNDFKWKTKKQRKKQKKLKYKMYWCCEW